ncbi:MAG TPA: carboxypeptidase-like regulatory domain-containing protein [Candidatus Acidoferrales bacterium]|jgi:hypothetical protein|nr:carboxypeptidase-like regulatory domain-containing protein [Candidatus Acidoferrales bacterium]
MGIGSAFLAVSVLCAAAVRAQTPDTATVRGEVADQSQAPVAHAEVTLTNTLSGLKREVHTDDSGSFSVSGLPVAGRYDITVHNSPRLSRQQWEQGRAGDLVMAFVDGSGSSRELLFSTLVNRLGQHDQTLLDVLENKIQARRQELSRQGRP